MKSSRRSRAAKGRPVYFWRILSRGPIGAAFRDRGQFVVGRFFLSKVLLQHLRAVVATENLGPRDQRSIAGHLVVLDRLRGGDESRVQNVLVVNFAGDFFSFLDDAVDRRTG